MNSTPVTVRFSDFAGIPTVSDNDPQSASPRGCAVRFHLAKHVHTDIVAHSVDAFPTRSVEGFLEFINALVAIAPAGPHPNAIEQFLGAHPAALTFVQTPKPIPTSFAKESFFAVSAFMFTNADGVSRHGRYRLLPVAGNEYLDEAAAAAQGPNFLFDEIRERVATDPVRFHIAPCSWPGTATPLMTPLSAGPRIALSWSFGEISLNEVTANNAAEQQRMIFDPIPRVDGIAASADPLFEPRANIYLMAGRRRRAAAEQ
ncbi:MAG: catalase [Stellaceae bacterium]